MNVEQTETLVAAVLLSVTGISSAGCSLFMFYAYSVCKKTRSPFKLICVGRCIAHLMNGIVYGIYFPMKLVFYMTNGYPSFEIFPLDHLVTIAWMTLTPTEFQLAANRFMAVNAPLAYGDVFTMKKTKVYVAIAWIVAVSWGTVKYITGCPVTFSPQTLAVEYQDRQCFVSDTFLLKIVVLPAMTITLLICASAFVQTTARLYKNRGTQANDGVTRNWLLFLQAIAQISCWVISNILWATDIRKSYGTRMAKFFFIPFPQIASHLMEAAMTIFFHYAHRRQIYAAS